MAWRDWIKSFFGRDKDAQATEVAKGVTVGSPSLGSTTGTPISTDSGFGALHGALSVDADLMMRYADYENMDDYVETSVALDLYADSSTIPDTVHGKTIWGLSRDKVMRDLIDDCMHRRCRIEEDIWAAVRTLCKYGNNFAEILVNEKGVVGLNWLPVPTIRRIVDEKGNLLGFVQDISGKFNLDSRAVISQMSKGGLPKLKEEQDSESKVVFFRAWEVVHWRLRSKQMRSQYGVSVLDSSRWIWKRLVMMEDMALVQKLTRSPGRFAFYVDTGDLPPKEAMALVKQVKRGYKKTKLVDPATGKLDFRYNPLSPIEDFWIPTRGGKESTRIETISGPDVQMMDDVDYFRNKLATSTKVPPAWLGATEGPETDKSLSEQDVRFARACMRIQREFIVGMRKVIRVHFAALNIDPDSVQWQIKMTVPSAIFEMQQIEVMNAQAALADSMSEWASKEWILERVFHFTQDDAALMVREKEGETDEATKREAATQADIMRMYPQLENVGGDEPANESRLETEIRGIRKIVEETSQTSSEMIKGFERLGAQVKNVRNGIKRHAN